MADYTCTLQELIERWDDLMVDPKSTMGITPIAKGFVIGRGSKLHWYIDPSEKTGLYRCYPTDDNGNVGKPSYHPYNKKVTVKY